MNFKGFWLSRNKQILEVIDKTERGWRGFFYVLYDNKQEKYPAEWDNNGTNYGMMDLDIMESIRSPEDPKCPGWLKAQFG